LLVSKYSKCDVYNSEVREPKEVGLNGSSSVNNVLVSRSNPQPAAALSVPGVGYHCVLTSGRNVKKKKIRKLQKNNRKNKGERLQQ
jgi:hypothetical protein